MPSQTQSGVSTVGFAGDFSVSGNLVYDCVNNTVKLSGDPHGIFRRNRLPRPKYDEQGMRHYGEMFSEYGTKWKSEHHLRSHKGLIPQPLMEPITEVEVLRPIKIITTFGTPLSMHSDIAAIGRISGVDYNGLRQVTSKEVRDYIEQNRH